MTAELRRVATVSRRKRAAGDDYRAAIVEAARAGCTHAAIAEAAGVTRQRVGAILHRYMPEGGEPK